jgi:hypothetical protein
MAENTDVLNLDTPELLAFDHVLGRPERLEVREVKALPLLNRVRKIEGCARPDVVHVPAVATVIVPSHAGFESGFDPANQQMSLTSKELADSERCFAAGSHERIVHSPAVVGKHSENGIVLQSSATPGVVCSSPLRVLSKLRAGFSIQHLSIFSSPFSCFSFYVLSILCLPFPKILASLFRVLFAPSLVLRCELFWVFFVITLLAYTSKLAFTFWGACSLRNTEFSSASSCACAPSCAFFFDCLHQV